MSQSVFIGGGGLPAGSDTQIQFNNAGAFGGITGTSWNGTRLTIVPLSLSVLSDGSANYPILIQPDEAAAPPFLITNAAFVNAGDAARKNQVVNIGWNVSAGGGAYDGALPVMFDSWESYYKPGGAAALSERHWGYYNPTGAVSRRILSTAIDNTTNVVVLGLSADNINFADPTGATNRVVIDGGGVLASFPINVIGTTNAVQALVRGASGQTANLQEWQIFTAGAIKAAINSTGQLELRGNGIPAIAGQLAVTSGGTTPATIFAAGIPTASSGTIELLQFTADTTGLTGTSGWRFIDVDHTGTFPGSGTSVYLRYARSGTSFFTLTSQAEINWTQLSATGFGALQYNGTNSNATSGFFRGTNAQDGISLRNALPTDDGTGVGFRLSVTTTAAYTAVTNTAANVLVLGTGQGGSAVNVVSVNAAGLTTISATGSLAFGSTGITSPDLYLSREAAAVFQLGADVNGAAVAQTLKACDGITGTDKTGGNFTLASGKGTGAGAVSSLIFQTPTVLGTGTTAQSLATRLTISSASVLLATAQPLAMASGTNQRAGDTTLVGGTVTVSNTTVTANTRVFVTRKTAGGTIGFAVTYTVSAGASFTLTSDNVLDTSVYSYVLIEVP